jgi:hypothetical protein
MALGSTQPLMEMSTRNLPGGKGRPARGADNLTAICEPIVYKMWEPRRLTTLWAFMACYRDSFTVRFIIHYYTEIRQIKLGTFIIISRKHVITMRWRWISTNLGSLGRANKSCSI